LTKGKDEMKQRFREHLFEKALKDSVCVSVERTLKAGYCPKFIIKMFGPRFLHEHGCLVKLKQLRSSTEPKEYLQPIFDNKEGPHSSVKHPQSSASPPRALPSFNASSNNDQIKLQNDDESKTKSNGMHVDAAAPSFYNQSGSMIPSNDDPTLTRPVSCLVRDATINDAVWSRDFAGTVSCSPPCTNDMYFDDGPPSVTAPMALSRPDSGMACVATRTMEARQKGVNLALPYLSAVDETQYGLSGNAAVERLVSIWDEIGLCRRERDQHLSELFSKVQAVYNQKLADEDGYAATFRATIAEKKAQLRGAYVELGMEPNNDLLQDSDGSISLTAELERLKIAIEEIGWELL
jgi:hypothetical protein